MQIVVIGAGVLGASAAFHLAREGVQVVVVDAELPGRATAAGAGIICPWVSGVQDEAFYRLYAAGGDYYATLIAALAEAGETDLGYRQSGAMLVEDEATALDWLEQMAMQRKATFAAMGEVTRLSAARAQALFPPLHPALGAIHISGGARVDGRRLAAALLRAAQRHGAVIRHGHAELLQDAGRIGGVALRDERMPVADPALDGRAPEGQRRERLAADRVIVTAGAWADRLLRPTGLGLPVEPQRGQIVHFQMPEAGTADWPVILPTGSHYIVPFDGGRIVAGATRETGAGFDYRVTAAGQNEVLSEALKIAPGLAAATLIETRVGFRPVSATARPLLGWLPKLAGVAVGNGLGAAGLTIGPLAGRLLADLVIGRPALVRLAPFDPAQQAPPTGVAPALR